jgi:hypothetical protein
VPLEAVVDIPEPPVVDDHEHEEEAHS